LGGVFGEGSPEEGNEVGVPSFADLDALKKGVLREVKGNCGCYFWEVKDTVWVHLLLVWDVCADEWVG
jgi:hypothetical protein